MKIGNIVTTGDLIDGEVYNIVTSVDDCIEGIPTLLIGLDYVREFELDYMERKLPDGRFWTLTRKESRKHHVQDLDKFKDHCFEEIRKSVTYLFVDPIQSSLSRMKKILTKIKSLDNIITYNHNNSMLYLFSDKLIFGIDLKLCIYLGINDTKIKDRIKSKSTVFLEHNEILIEYKDYMERLNNEVKYIPLLYSIKNDDKNTSTSNIH